MTPFRFEHAFLGAAVVLTLICLGYFASLLDLAPELSDASYYIINIAQVDQITNQISMFGILWYSIFGDLSVVQHRTVHIALIFISGAALCWCYSGTYARLSVRLAASLLAGCAFLSVLFWVLLEPNYNTMVLMAFAVSCICARPFLEPLSQLHSSPKGTPTISALGFGASMMVLALVKITAAAAVGAFWLIAYWAVHAPELKSPATRTQVLRHFGILALWTVLGFTPVFALLALRGFDPIDLWERFEAGRQSIALLNSHALSPALVHDKFSEYMRFVSEAGQTHAPYALLLIISVVVAGSAPYFKVTTYRWALSLSGVAAVGCVTWLIMMLSVLPEYAHSELFALLRFGNLATAGILLWYNCHPRLRSSAIILVAAALGPFFLSVGTNNSWSAQFALYSGLSLSVALVLFARSPERLQMAFAPVIASLVLGLFLSVWNTMQRFPYRMGDTLNTANVQITYGSHGEVLRTTPALAHAYVPLKEAHETLMQSGDTPVFLDMTGRAPGIGNYLGLQPPSVAWTLSGYPGSDAYFGYALSRLSPAQLKNAWLLIPDPDHPVYSPLDIRILAQALEQSAEMLDDYIPVARIEITYIKMTATLYKPKASEEVR